MKYLKIKKKTTVGVDFKIKTLDIDGKLIKCQIWDTAGQEKYRTIINAYYRNANGIIIVYDLTNRVSFNNVKSWLLDFENGAQNINIPKLLIGNKSDLESVRQVDFEAGKELAEELDLKFLETSAKTAQYVKEAFYSIAREIKYKVEEEQLNNAHNTDTIKVGKSQSSNMSSCC